MKSRILFFLIILCPFTSKAQFNVNQYGNVGIGINVPLLSSTRLSVGTAMPGYGGCFLSGDTGILFLKTDTTNNDPTYGIYANTSFKTHQACGMKMIAKGKSGISVAGIHAIMQGGSGGCGVMGGLGGASNMIRGVGVLGSTSNSFSMPTTGIYAGYFFGDVRVTGAINGTILSPAAASGSSEVDEEGNNAERISEEVSSVIENLQQVELLKMSRINNDGSIAANKIVDKPQHENVSELTADEFAEEEDEEPIQTKLSSISYGLAADQLKQVYPELVYEDEEGNYSINYIEMVPLLVQSIKELSSKVEKLEQQLGVQSQARKVKSETTGIEVFPNEIDLVRMDQNRPNPFSESTVIGLNIPDKTQKANIFIYDLSGKQIQNVPVAERGETNITVYASDLGAGMYIYTLVVDGKVAVTRRMIVEK